MAILLVSKFTRKEEALATQTPPQKVSLFPDVSAQQVKMQALPRDQEKKTPLHIHLSSF